MISEIQFTNRPGFVGFISVGIGLAGLVASAQAPKSPPSGKLAVLPASALLDGGYSQQTVIVTLTKSDGSVLNVTSQADFKSVRPGIVRYDGGVALPLADGETELVASFGGQSAKAKLTVRNAATNANLSVANDITPILLKAGCNGSACHGGANGQGGFKLSLFGYEADKDREAIWGAGKTQRVNPKDPASSMILNKATGTIPHGGGKRFAKDSVEYRTFIAWIKARGPLGPKVAAATPTSGTKLASNAPASPPAALPEIASITAIPGDRLVTAPKSVHQLIVMATYSDGSSRDVTPLARYSSDDEGIVSVSSAGKASALRHGEANIMVRYAGKAAVSRFLSLTKPRPATYPSVPENNVVDKHVFAKLKRMGIVPSGLTSDSEFIRRVSLDIAGVLPTSNQVRNFVESKDSDKRKKLIDDLLERPEYQDVMTIQWSELLRINRLFLQEAGVKQYTAFVRESFADNKPFDQFVRELVGSVSYDQSAVERSRDAVNKTDQAVYRKASNYHNGPINFYRVTADPTELATSATQIFLGVRLECSRCHNHPFDRWTMKDYYGLAAYFAGTGYTGGKAKDEIVIFLDKNGSIKNPRDNQVAHPKPLTVAEGKPDTAGKRHQMLAEWMTAADNPFFAKATVNRFWKHFFGRGIVNPVDDFRATNPPVNEPLLDALASEFVANKFDLKWLIRAICGSRTYQLSDKTNATNESDTKNFSRYYTRRLGPEVLFDAIVTATGVGETFGGAVARRATNLPDNSIGSYFLDTFGRSRRMQVQERSEETSMSQALHLMNGGTINDRISNPNGKIATLLKSQLTPPQAIEEIYMATLSRAPKESELKAGLLYLEKSASPKEGYEDLMWAILNSREFIFNH